MTSTNREQSKAFIKKTTENKPEQLPSNYPKDILISWYVTELLSPKTFKKQNCSDSESDTVIDTQKEDFPWLVEQKAEEKLDKDKYYHILLGVLDVNKITKLICDKYGDIEGDPPKGNKFAALGYITVDSNGKIVNNGIASSSFAWASKKILDDDFKSLPEWHKAEDDIREFILSLLDEDVPINKDYISNITSGIGDKFGISDQIIVPCSMLEVTQNAGANPPSPPLLNSFFLKDILAAISLVHNKKSGIALERYLGASNPIKKIDVMKDESFLKNILSPNNLRQSRWPSPGNFPLALLQQAVVNSTKDMDKEGLIAVNGPPGTGKTTLLRDLVADIVLQRAKALAKFDKPKNAFKEHKLEIVPNRNYSIYQIDDSLKGFEILVASTNNKAVENISKELPNLKAIDECYQELDYFRTTSDALMDGADKSWGLIAAVMGKSQNRTNFSKAFENNDIGVKNLLRIANGENFAIGHKNDEANNISRLPKSVNERTPKNQRQAQEKWTEIRNRFEEAIGKVEILSEEMERAKEANSKLVDLNRELDLTDIDLEDLYNKRATSTSDLYREKDDLANEEPLLEELKNKIECHLLVTPHWFYRILRLPPQTTWERDLMVLGRDQDRQEEKCNDLREKIRKLDNNIKSYEEKIKTLELRLKSIKNTIEEYSRLIERGKSLAGDLFGNEEFWNQPKDRLHLSSPWLGEEIQKARANAFTLSMELHQAFIEASAYEMRANLNSIIRHLKDEPIHPLQKQFLQDMWSSLFLLVPVISSTFASVEKMLANVPPEGLGWLFIDEAGQATPQAAIGAIMRAKKAIVVGDPIQIEPIANIPENLIKSICKFWGVDHERWSAPSSSVQICADRASPYITTIEGSSESRIIGFPLLVHRRCDNPMFEISNHIAYNNLMVMATPPRQSRIRDLLGPSSWLHVEDKSDGKWCPSEGKIIINCIKKLLDNGITNPDIYIISPFKDTSYQMHQMMRGEKGLLKRITGAQGDFKAVNAITEEWLKNNIGTIHTFQGKEAEVVFMLLGAQHNSETKARIWASSRPNILNVAITRSKSLFYFVGNIKEWGTLANYQFAAQRMPLVNCNPNKDDA